MVVVVPIGLLAAKAVPAMLRDERPSEASRFVSDLRTFPGAFQTFAMRNGR